MTTDKPRLIIEPDDYTIERDFVVINLIERSYPFATAPPKDWRPICYDSQYNKLNGCDPLVITNSCAICPFLAFRHKTKVTQKSGGLDINLDINGQVKE